MKIFSEFKTFALKGNLIDISLAFVMGAAFGKIITSFTEGVISPLIGIIGGTNLNNNRIILKQAVYDLKGKMVQDAVAIKWGEFLTAVINFIIVAFVMFLIIKAINKYNKKEVVKLSTGPSATELLLTEIRDELKEKKRDM